MERKAFFYSEGAKLAGTMYIPEDGAREGRRRAIVMLRGYASNARDEGPAIFFYRYACTRGYVVLSMDFRGFGDSEGPRGRMIPLDEVEDVRNAITFLQEQAEVDADNIGVWGTSFGGAVATYTAALDKRIKAVVANIPVGNGEKWLRGLRNNWEWQEFLDELREDRARRVLSGVSKMVDAKHIKPADPVTQAGIDRMLKEDPNCRVTKLPLETGQAIIEFNPDEVVHKIAPRAILFIAAEKDLITPPELAKEMYDKAGEPKKYFLVPGVNHFQIYAPPYGQLVMDEALAWFDQYMPSAPIHSEQFRNLGKRD